MDQNPQLKDHRVLPDSTAAVADERKHEQYMKWVGSIVFAGGMLIVLFVALVDPYRLFKWVDIEGVNRVKPFPGQYREQIKLSQVKEIQPTALLFGNSRIEVGLDPASQQLQSRGYLTYNLALSGTALATAQDMFFQVRHETAPPVMAVLGIEFLDFLVNPAARSATAGNSEGGQQRWQWHFDTLFSVKALTDSWMTLRIQKTADPETMTSHGQTPLLEYNRHALREGYHLIFQQRAQENAKSILRKPHNLYDASGHSGNAERLREMLAIMAQDGTEVHLVIYPYHAQLMAMFGEAGLQATMEEWKSLLLGEVETIQGKYPGSRIKLWDFSGYGPVQCELIPAAGDTQAVTQFYWEAGHFKTSVGELILQRILGAESGFGMALNKANVERNRQRILAEREQCMRVNPNAFTTARSFIGAARKQLN